MAERFTRVALTASVITALGLAGCSNADDQKPKGYIPRMVQINPDAVIRSGIVESDPSNADGSSGNIIDRDSLPGAITGFNNPYLYDGVHNLGNVVCTYNPFTESDNDLMCVPTEDTSIDNKYVPTHQIMPLDDRVQNSITWSPWEPSQPVVE